MSPLFQFVTTVPSTVQRLNAAGATSNNLTGYVLVTLAVVDRDQADAIHRVATSDGHYESSLRRGNHH